MPIDFILFALTLSGVAILHHHTLAVALTGLAVIIAYQLLFSAFPAGPGLAGLASHLSHEWVIIANLACLLLGFAILSRHFDRLAAGRHRRHQAGGGDQRQRGGQHPLSRARRRVSVSSAWPCGS